jgi:hypothetical protein
MVRGDNTTGLVPANQYPKRIRVLEGNQTVSDLYSNIVKSNFLQYISLSA